MRKIWNEYTDNNGKFSESYVEYCKPYSRRITKDALLKYGLSRDKLYGEPIYNILTGEKYKHIQDWIEKEKLEENSIYDLFLKISTCPLRFVNPENIYSQFDGKTMKEVYEEDSFNINLYLSNKKFVEEKNEKKFKRDLKKYNSCPKWITEKLEKNKEYSFKELEDMFKPIFENKNIIWDKSSVIRCYFPNSIKRFKRRINNISMNYYIFNIF